MMQTQREEKKTNCCVQCGISDLSRANRCLRFHAQLLLLVADGNAKRSQTDASVSVSQKTTSLFSAIEMHDLQEFLQFMLRY